jgi:hypothetical protein
VLISASTRLEPAYCRARLTVRCSMESCHCAVAAL